MLGSKASLEPHEEICRVLGVGSVDGGHELLEGALEGRDLLERPGGSEAT